MSALASTLFGPRRIAIAAAAAICGFLPASTGIATKAAIGVAVVTAATVMETSEAAARPRVRDHRTPTHKKPRTWTHR